MMNLILPNTMTIYNAIYNHSASCGTTVTLVIIDTAEIIGHGSMMLYVIIQNIIAHTALAL